VSAHLVVGIAAATAAAGCYETAYVLQALEARRMPVAHSLRPALIGALARRPLWVTAIALAVVGWPFQLLALSRAPITVVQPTLALGLLLLVALAARVLGERIGRRELAGVAAIVAGVAGIALAAPPHSAHHAGPATLLPVLLALAALAASPYLLRAAGRNPGALLVLGAGAGDAWAGFAAKLVTDALAGGHWLAAAGWGTAAAVAVGAGLLSEMTALAHYAATRVGPVVLVMQIAVPVALAPLVGGERWGGTPLGGGVLVASLAVVAAGAAVLGSSRAVAHVREHD